MVPCSLTIKERYKKAMQKGGKIMAARIIIISKGSAGDIHPYVGIGQALLERGNEVFFIANDYFKGTIEEAGLQFASMGTRDEYELLQEDPRAQHPRKSFQFLVEEVFLGKVERNFSIIENLYKRGESVVLAHPTAPEGRLANEILGVPLVSGVPQPMWLRSMIEPPRSSLNIPRWGPRWYRFIYWMLDTFTFDPRLKPLNRFRSKHGREPVKHFMKDWWFSPQRMIGFFPEWFAPRQDDWPNQFVHTGFVLHDGTAKNAPLDEEWEQTLGKWQVKPVVFTTGTPFRHEDKFFETVCKACRYISMPCILLTQYPEQLPEYRSSNVYWWPFIPFNRLFPRAEVVVHHGGINTVGACLAAGVPQLVVPTRGGFDQVDNGARIEELGVGRMISRKRLLKLGPRALAQLIHEMPGIHGEASAAWAEKMKATNPLPQICEMIETLAGYDSNISKSR